MEGKVLLVALVILQIVLAALAQTRPVINDMHVDKYELVIGGKFNHVLEGGNVPVTQPELINIALYGHSSFFNYGNWSQLVNGLPQLQAVTALTSHLITPTSRAVYAAGKLANNDTTTESMSVIAQFTADWNVDNGGVQLLSGAWSHWSPVTAGNNGATKYAYNGMINVLYATRNMSTNVNDTASHSNHLLYVAGSFSTMTAANGDQIAAGSIARFDSNTTTWSTMLGGVSSETGVARIYDVIHMSNSSVLVVGSFTHAGGVPANNIALYACDFADNCEWRAVGPNNVVGIVYGARAVVSGNDTILYIGGDFTVTGLVNGTNAAALNLTTGTWSALHYGIKNVNEVVFAVEVDEYCVYYGGRFVITDALTSQDGDMGQTSNIACFGLVEQNWIALGSGVDSYVRKIRAGAIYSGPEIVFEKRVYVAGNFSTAGGESIASIAYYVDRGYGPYDGAWVDIKTGTAINLYAFIVLGIITVISSIFGVVYCIWSYKKKKDLQYQQL